MGCLAGIVPDSSMAYQRFKIIYGLLMMLPWLRFKVQTSMALAGSPGGDDRGHSTQTAPVFSMIIQDIRRSCAVAAWWHGNIVDGG
jgi:hypothetical protein